LSSDDPGKEDQLQHLNMSVSDSSLTCKTQASLLNIIVRTCPASNFD